MKSMNRVKGSPSQDGVVLCIYDTIKGPEGVSVEIGK